MKRTTLMLSAFLMGTVTSVAQADPACDAEVATIQAALDAPDASVSAADLEQAMILFDILSGNCAGGSTLADEAPTSQQIRALLGMGDS